MRKFKVHMVRYSDEECFSTMCGINDGCSEAFYDCPDNMVRFGDTNKTTCKTCLALYQKELEAECKRVSELEEWAKQYLTTAATTEPLGEVLYL